uniref:Leucine-rich repeat-containing N-terminal plant-type domain-containing protein n=1 Tax=Quercus lobata TaxID=97700 RepID=A0A7N2MKE4_QUELO
MNQFLPLLLASCLFFISHSQITSNTYSQHACHPDQSSALLQLRQEFIEKRISFDHVRYFDHSDYINYYSISYPKMKFWKSDTDCCSWDGVTCDAEIGLVIGLDLSNSWLCGSLESNSSLFSLRHLQKLNLAVNNFSSYTIPSEFGQLVSSLKQLHLSFTNFSGELPHSIGNLKFEDIRLEQQPNRMLEVLNIAKNKLNNTFPFWLESLPELQILVLRENGFHGPIWDPHTKFGFFKLRVICLSQNNFSSKLPTEYFKTWNAMLMGLGKNK